MSSFKTKTVEVLVACLIVAPAGIYQTAKRTATAERVAIPIIATSEAGKTEVWEPEAWKAPDPCDSVYVDDIESIESQRSAKKSQPVAKDDCKLSDSEIYELANCVYAEAGNQGEKGMLLVCDVILNRVRDSDYPDTIHGVITQRNQFTCHWDGGMDRWKPTKECIEICEREAGRDTTSYPGIFYYTAGKYSAYGSPAFVYKAHYFSTK